MARTVGPGKAKELIFTGRLILGQEAARIGLVNYSVPQNETKDAAYQRSLGLAREILPNVRGMVYVKFCKNLILLPRKPCQMQYVMFYVMPVCLLRRLTFVRYWRCECWTIIKRTWQNSDTSIIWHQCLKKKLLKTSLMFRVKKSYRR